MAFAPRSRWTLRETALLLLALGVGAWCLRAALADIWGVAIHNEEQSHILLAPFVAAWLFWLRRSRLRALHLKPSLWGPVVAALGWVMSWLGFEFGVEIAWHLGSLICLLGCIISLTGLTILWQYGPAFAAFLFLIPVPGTIRQLIAVPLQAMATAVTQGVLELAGVPAVRLGHVLVINGEQVAVGEACNGMRMVFALTLIVYAFAFSAPLRMSVRVVLIGLSPLAALVSNVIRLVPTALFFGYGDLKQAQAFHNIAGWVMLPVAFIMLIAVLRLIRWIELPVTPFRLAMR